MAGYSGDGAAATKAQLNGPQAVAVDAAGNVYIGDSLNNVVRKVNASGVISTFAGNGYGGFSGDLGSATSAQIGSPTGLAIDASGSVYISDGGGRIRRVSGGLIVTVAGGANRAYLGDGGPAEKASLNSPQGLAFDSKGNLYVADSANNAVRLLQPLASGVTLSAVTNGASNLIGPVAPGEVVVLYGSNIGPSTFAANQPDSTGVYGTTLSGVTVYVNGVPAPILYAWTTQVAAAVPYSISGSTGQFVVQYQNTLSAPIALSVAASAPGIFTYDYSGKGQAAAYNMDGTFAVNGAARPIKTGSSIALYVTGSGQTTPGGTDGAIGSAQPPVAALPVSVTIGGASAQVTYKGGITGVISGVTLIVAQVPTGIATGSAVPVSVQVSGVAAQSGVTIAIQ